ncbi:MAG: 4'-phosphopantetheinyl transferase superfamily protein [Bacteroidales bacterium]|nr:4'-phosphopantetheinyl transferase superfamily protein [Bacteroidales bacterium]
MTGYFPLIVPPDLICEESPIMSYSTLMESGCNNEIHPKESDLISGESTKRQNEFITGRICARRALKNLQIYNFPILFNEHKLPLFPSTVKGSIAHTSSYCAVVLGLNFKYKSIGIDIEHISKMKSRYFNTLCTNEELLFLKKYSEQEQMEKATILFSAKEAFYKLQFQITQKMLFFKDVCCSILDDNTFSIRLYKQLDKQFYYNATFAGLYYISNEMIFTALHLEVD